MTIKVGDNVIWRSGKHKRKNFMPMGIAAKVISFGTSEDDRPAATLSCGMFGTVNAYVEDLEPIEAKPKLTILSGG